MPEPPQDASVVRTVAGAPSDPLAQEAAIQDGRGRYSHGRTLPLELSLERTGWFSRAISVTTTETVWYRDAVTYIEVPAPFTYDLASIPSLVWFIVSPWDVALESLFHDLLYRKQLVRRRVADQTMLSMMEDRGVPCLIRWTVYSGVRIGGWVAWKKHAAENRTARIAEQNSNESKTMTSRLYVAVTVVRIVIAFPFGLIGAMCSAVGDWLMDMADWIGGFSP